jgi:tetratricopeptide (TPR) repeat protein
MKKFLFRKEKRRSNPYRVLILLALVLAGLFLLRGYGSGEVEELFRPTPTPTRTSGSFSLEAQTHFQAGNLDAAIQSYQGALLSNPSDARLWLELAQIQAYSSNLLTTNTQRRQRLQDSLSSARKAAEFAPDDGTAYAVLAFSLDWNASLTDNRDEREKMLLEAERTAQQALLKDPNNVLALAYTAEILLDQGRLDQAQQYITLAKERDENRMDVQRVRAQILETLGDYQGAIDAYDRAIAIAPNLTFLYIRAGVIYRFLGMSASAPSVRDQNYNMALEYFARAVELNKQLNINDPVPYIAIGKVYTQMGEFLIASRNAKKALQIDPTSPDLYGQLGMVYFKARNYESAIPAFQCAVEGCQPTISCEVRECLEGDPNITIEGITLEANDPGTVVYYYTYGSVLAGLHRPVGPTNGYCQRALVVFDDIRQVFGGDAVIMSIVEASESICESYGVTRTGVAISETPGQPTVNPQVTPTPAMP